ncbi:glycyl-tRNA synthetase beta chain [Lactococcus termiticola]|uniref:Glycine--tRNA ligase beta subunit n=2 Tax=Lactococcus termiticola TaxID=2169526 RepID=A0A2R5HGE5_9LACT|nr:glycyl-tRNA synthetase beta chain [Lactococcus termiticola]
MSNYLLEIGLEEMPAHLVTASERQLAERVSDFLKENRVNFKNIVRFSTPRRLAVLVEDIAEQSEAMDEEVKGPAAKIAKDNEGNWSKAIQGFSRGQGLTPDDLELRGDYYYATKHTEGVATADVLKNIGAEVIEKMQFSTYMKWGNNSFLFVRPIQWIVSLLDVAVVDFDLLDVKAGRKSRGHRFLANRAIELVDARLYEKALQDNFVIAYAPARKLLVAQEIQKLADKHGWEVELHADLLEEVNNIVEWPTAFVGNFDEKYLAVPEEVLVTSMRDNQRYFELHTKEGKLAPHFISVRNGNDEHMDNVIKGNEKVLVARLEDAEFFWREDQKLKIDDLVKKLEKVTFHAKIGSLTEHMARTKAIAAKLAPFAELSDAEKADVARAADIYKFDLLTNMVNEFDELQGVMGEKYALLAGENENVATAIREHYMPTSAEGALPESKVGAVLAVADKLDSILSFFSAGLIPSGSNDPYALRRAAQGLIRILEKFDWQLDLAEFILEMEYENKEQVLEFVQGRIQKMLLDSKVRHDIVDAVIHASHFNIVSMLETAQVINEHKDHEPFKPAMENVGRVINLVKKAENLSNQVDSSLFENEQEKELARVVESLKADWLSLNNALRFRSIVHSMTPAISQFFEHTMVMAEDEKVRANRLNLLGQLVELTATLADFSLINTK